VDDLIITSGDIDILT
jgi:hypothetical protein